MPIDRASFGRTLRFITNLKLEELEKQRLAYQAHAKVLEEAKSLGEKDEILKKVEILATAVKSWNGSGALGYDKSVGGKLETTSLDFWLQQAKKDPSFSHTLAQGWAKTLEEHIKHNLMRFDSAKLFGSLFNEWIASGDSVALTYTPGGHDSDATESASDSNEISSVQSGRQEMHEQSAKFKSIVFDGHSIDIVQVEAYLKQLFSSEDAVISLNQLKKELGDFGDNLHRRLLEAGDVRRAIVGLLASGLMDEERRATLKTFLDNSLVLDELASVLNMRMSSIASWKWPTEGVLVEFRRHFNGKYRAFTDPEIIDALLLHHIGTAWQHQLKHSLLQVFDSKAWLRPTALSGLGQKSYRAHLGSSLGPSIDSIRNTDRCANFFAMQLQERIRDKPKAQARWAPRGKNTIKPALVKQKLLHIAMTECALNMALHGTHASVCSDLEWFGPSLPHTTILTVLGFLGMKEPWLGFFKEFLSMPLRFPDEAGSRIRKRGTPISYSLSALCGEVVMFIMDFAVNQRADGLFLYRTHNDLWLWDPNVKKVTDGWEEMNRYASLVGLKFNESKTGSAYVGHPSPDAVSLLPKGTIRWGFLKFDVAAARFVLDQQEVDNHIVEMRRQLASTKSVFGWVNAYNKYMAFFLRNFGGIPANCFGKDHVNDLVDTLGRIQRELFPAEGDSGGSAVGHLRKTLQERFGITDLPEGYFYLPIGSGGLELRNTMIELLALQRGGQPLVSHIDSEDGIDETHLNDGLIGVDSFSGLKSLVDTKTLKDKPIAQQIFLLCMAVDAGRHAKAKETWEANRSYKKSKNHADAQFIPFEEYTSIRESYLSAWGRCYSNMLQSPAYMYSGFVAEAANITRTGVVMGWYEQWIVKMYGEEIIKKFGRLKAVDPNLIPVGMVQLFRTSRMKLDQ